MTVVSARISVPGVQASNPPGKQRDNILVEFQDNSQGEDQDFQDSIREDNIQVVFLEAPDFPEDKLEDQGFQGDRLEDQGFQVDSTLVVFQDNIQMAFRANNLGG
uniref:Uncharacterized protein n=1 Tax=Cacopsylla melanoneura TaxID=428564 RepID=A0A8D8XYG7_9HEMI